METLYFPRRLVAESRCELNPAIQRSVASSFVFVCFFFFSSCYSAALKGGKVGGRAKLGGAGKKYKNREGRMVFYLKKVSEA